MKFYFILTAALVGSLSTLEAKTFTVDQGHTNVQFKVRHLLTKVTGRFQTFEGTFETDDKTGALKKFTGTVTAKSINTDNEKRDTHLRSPDFFDVEKYPTLTFTSDPMTIALGQSGSMKGKMTMKGITKDVTFNIEYLGESKDPWGNGKAAFSATIPKINRKDFGLNWNKALETGGVLVGDEVEITLDVEGNLKISPEEAAKAAATKTADKKASPAKK